MVRPNDLSEDEEEAARVRNILDLALLALEQGQMKSQSPETVASARSYVESLLPILGTTQFDLKTGRPRDMTG